MQEISAEAEKIVAERARRTGRTKKDLLSTLILRSSAWGENTLALMYGEVPDSVTRQAAFWDAVEGELLKGLGRCREKYGG